MLIFHVGGYGAPYLDVVVERSDAPLRSPAPVRDLKPLLSQGSERQVVEGAALGRSRRRKPFRLQKDQIVVTLEREGYVHPRRWSLPRGALPLLEAMRGERTVAELAEDFAELVDEDDLVELVEQLLPEHMGLAVPAP